jgi:DNA-binding response OmpR family regulator
MMSRISYETAETLIYDPVSANRAATRASLYSVGFRHIESVATLDAFAECIRRRPPDLAFCEAQGADTELCNSIQSLRQGADGFNPFVVIIVTAWENSKALVTRVLNSGADDLILRPFSTSILGARIKSHVERRKSFVITSDYVGPDRRRDRSRPSNVELFEPPNSLKMKAQDRLSADEMAHRLDFALKTAREVLNSEKLRRDAFQICILWRLVQQDLPGTPAYDADVAKLTRVTKDVAARSRGTDFDAALEWCDGVLAALEGLAGGADRNPTMHLLGHAALNLNQVFAPEKSAEEHLRDIDATIAVINARNETTALAS